MVRAARALAVLTLAAPPLAFGPAAFAQTGNGLYEPFPKAAVEKRAKRFVDQLRFQEPVRFSNAQLERGAFVDARAVQIDEPLSESAARGEASARARADRGDADGVPLPAQVLLLALATAALALLAGRRPRRVARG
jgi:hypothetical protein